MQVKDVMSDYVVVVQDTQQVAYARNLMLKHGFSRIIVLNSDEKPVGIISEKDITHKMGGEGPNWKKRPIDKISIKRVMNSNLITISPEEHIKQAVDRMLKNDVSSLIVVDDEGLAGILTKTDLLEVYVQKFAGKWKIADLMTPEVITVDENHSINHVINLMEEKKIGRIVVNRNSMPIGIITSKNISFAYVEDPETGVNMEKVYFIRQIDGEEKKNVKMVSMLTASDVMSNYLLVVEENVDSLEASKLMLKEDISGLPVVRNDELVGIITKTDIIKGIQ